MSHVVAAAAVLPALTAWQARVEHAAVQPGQRVLVHGGAGGVGAFVTQLATALGASVTSTAHDRHRQVEGRRRRDVSLTEGRAAYESGAVRRPRPGKTVLVVRD